MYIPALTLARVAYYISKLIVPMHKYILAATVLQRYTYYPTWIAYVNTYYRESDPLSTELCCTANSLFGSSGPIH